MKVAVPFQSRPGWYCWWLEGPSEKWRDGSLCDDDMRARGDEKPYRTEAAAIAAACAAGVPPGWLASGYVTVHIPRRRRRKSA